MMKWDGTNHANSKKRFPQTRDIEFIGVWDTVDSVGLIPRRLPYTRSNPIVQTFRQAVALDEHRVKFKVRLWNQRPEKTKKPKRWFKCLDKWKKDDEKYQAQERKNSGITKCVTNIEEDRTLRSDIGGGSVDNEATTSLARISLRWMVRECYKAGTGILFHSERLRAIGLDHVLLDDLRQQAETARNSTFSDKVPNHQVSTDTDDYHDGEKVGKQVQVPEETTKTRLLKPGTSDTLQRKAKRSQKDKGVQATRASVSEDELEIQDALSPIYDQLSRNPFWWLLEIIPFMTTWRKHDRRVKLWKRLGFGMGGARVIPIPGKDGKVKVHSSVYSRMSAKDDKGKTYQPKAKFARKGMKSQRGETRTPEQWAHDNNVEWVY
ncbi:hypothetical protein MPER_12979 [Moniliophthora perniciosa FA553]|nr:hypothetical protein MPER_12979 [Moniliophthora perniciosa FA553]